METYEKPWLAKDKAAKLCRAVNRAGVSFEYFCERRKIKQETINRAKALSRQWDTWAKNMVLNMGGTWNGEKLEKKPVIQSAPVPKRSKKRRRANESVTAEALRTGRKVSEIRKERHEEAQR